MFRKLSRLEILSNPEARRRELAEDQQEGALRVAEQGGRCLRGVVLILEGTRVYLTLLWVET